METQVKPGTRCEGLREYVDGRIVPCGGKAVRMVTVRFEYDGSDHRTHRATESVPMCEPCARFHEEHL